MMDAGLGRVPGSSLPPPGAGAGNMRTMGSTPAISVDMTAALSARRNAACWAKFGL